MKNYATKQKLIPILVLIIFSYQTSVLAHRPLTTEDAGVGSLGEFVLEVAYEQVRVNSEREHAGLFALVAGLEWAEVGIEGAYLKTADDNRGFGDLLFSAKVLLAGRDEKSGMLTLKGEVLTTTGNEDEGLGNEDMELAGSAVISKSLGEILIFHGQLGYNYIRDGHIETNSCSYGAAIDFLMTEKFNFSAEITGSYNKDESISSLGGGFFYQIHKKAIFDFLISKGITDKSEDWIITAGSTFIF